MAQRASNHARSDEPVERRSECINLRLWNQQRGESSLHAVAFSPSPQSSALTQISQRLRPAQTPSAVRCSLLNTFSFASFTKLIPTKKRHAATLLTHCLLTLSAI